MVFDWVWVSDCKVGISNFILIIIIGEILFYLKDLYNLIVGVYIVNSDCELIYINIKGVIIKLLKDMNIFIIFIGRVDDLWML